MKADRDGVRLISTAQMSAVRRALRGLVRDGGVIDLGRHYPNTRRHWCSKRTELSHKIQRKRKAMGALTLCGQVDEVARLSQQMGPLFERARAVGIEPYAEAMKPKRPKLSAASRGDPVGRIEASGLAILSDREAVAACYRHGQALHRQCYRSACRNFGKGEWPAPHASSTELRR